MLDISRIRTLISQGKSDAEIAAQLQAEAHDDGFGHNPGRTLRILAKMMHRAVTETRAVSAYEVTVQLMLFRRFWEEIAARGDAPAVEGPTLQRLAVITPAPSVGNAYVQLHGDMAALCGPVSAATTPSAKKAREAVERRYLRQVRGKSVICCAGAASAVADATTVLFETLGDQAHYRDLFPSSVLDACTPLLLMYHPTWTELLEEAVVQ